MHTIRSNRRRVASALLLVAAVVGASASASAQPMTTGLAGVGATDQYWLASLNGGSYDPAWVINRSSGNVWWIWVTTQSSLPGGSADGYFQRDRYSFRTSFSGAGLQSVDFRCGYDDAFSQLTLNGVVVPTTCGAYNLGPTQTLTGFVAGTNTLQLDVSGNGVTDGLVLSVDQVHSSPVTTTPEPASLALVGTGIVGLLVRARRRR